jgi:hypothetical protein
MKRLLFVRGFDSSNDLINDQYKPIYLFFKRTKYKLVYFGYHTSEPLSSVYEKLYNIIRHGNFRVLMGHSLGSALVAKYVRDNPINSYDHIILTMPFISATSTINTLLKCTFAYNIKIAKALIIPNPRNNGIKTSLFSKFISVLANDSFELINIHQLFDAKQDLFLNDEQIISLFDLPNIKLIYSDHDSLVHIDAEVLDKINNKYIVSGGHECYNYISYSNQFFDALSKIITS